MLTFWEHLRIFKFGIDGTVLAGAIPKKQLMQIQSWLKENEEDGIVYGENRSGMIKILEARHVYGGVLIVKFSNGEVRFKGDALPESAGDLKLHVQKNLPRTRAKIDYFDNTNNRLAHISYNILYNDALVNLYDTDGTTLKGTYYVNSWGRSGTNYYFRLKEYNTDAN